jgi:lysophospholipase L1-like esterase
VSQKEFKPMPTETSRSFIAVKARLPAALSCVFLFAGGGCSSDSSDASSGGAAQGGATTSSGGRIGGTGGVATGGTSQTGGAISTGGTTGGTATGGASNLGGTATGGNAPGGGGGTQGGTAGIGTGGTNVGGAAGGGTSGAGGARGGAAGSPGGAGAGGTNGGAAGSGTSGAGGAGASYCPTMAGTPCNIMPVGDSITEGCCTAPMGGYRMQLFHQALTNNKNITFVGTLTNGPSMVDGQSFPQRHEGHGGWKISQIAGVIDNAISSSKPHIVLLKIGTNDINGNDNLANAPTRLANLIDQICKDAPNALLVVSAIVPTTTDGTNNNVRSYNTAIKQKAEAAAAAGKHVVFVDNYQAFTNNANYKTALMADNLHPNTAGYTVLGDSFYNVISAYLPAK